MWTIVKNIISFILPVTVVILVPRWIESKWVTQNGFQFIGGVIVVLAGLTIMLTCIFSFIRIGKGTLAPWSPPKNFVAVGLYRYVRNPMILGVLTVLLGEALMFNSKNILAWAGLFFIINTLYFFTFEEPQLEERFGKAYRDYKSHVNRWIPRFTPYQPKEKSL
jgi:protein-S-isoprenylcysteine O-methyltransferase Ste14